MSAQNVQTKIMKKLNMGRDIPNIITYGEIALPGSLVIVVISSPLNAANRKIIDTTTERPETSAP